VSRVDDGSLCFIAAQQGSYSEKDKVHRAKDLNRMESAGRGNQER